MRHQTTSPHLKSCATAAASSCSAPRRIRGGSPLILAATHPPRLSEVVDMWRVEHTVFAVIAFIAAFMLLMVPWHRAGDVSQAKTVANCQKAGGMWDSKMNMCMEKKQ